MCFFALHVLNFFQKCKPSRMGIQEFQNFIETDAELSKNGVKGVDLVKTAWKLNKSQGQVQSYFLHVNERHACNLCSDMEISTLLNNFY